MFRQITVLILALLINIHTSSAQQHTIMGDVSDSEETLPFLSLIVTGGTNDTTIYTSSDLDGRFLVSKLLPGSYQVKTSSIRHESFSRSVVFTNQTEEEIKIKLSIKQAVLDEIVITGTMSATSKTESPVPVEVYTPTFFKKNPTPSIYEALQNVNGVRPQINCAVCNTGDIHINGLEGPYTMVLIDGMPIVSGLSTVYGLSGIPMSIIERVEVVKGPASTLYGSEAVGGIINVITKSANKTPVFSADVFGSSWGEISTDLATKVKLNKNVQTLLGVNLFNYNNRIDNNADGFTDLATQNRFSIFNKWNFKRKENRIFSLAARYYHENRFGGEMDWTKENRGGTDVYGESIYTDRWELFGTYQLPIKEKVVFQFSANSHDQNSVYGDTWYLADQKIGFGQLTWNKPIGTKHDFLFGSAMRYTYYDDSTPATASADPINPTNQPTNTYLPGIFVQDEIAINKQNKVLLGMRYDYNSSHGSIFTPRANYKITSKNKNNILRLSLGTGYRVVNVFTEEHAALTGSREVIVASNLNPETSYNGNINFVKKIFSTKSDFYLGIDASLFYTYFNNKIFADYDRNPNQIIYDNLNGFAVSNGASINFDLVYKNLSLLLGSTLMDVYSVEEDIKARQKLTERFSGTWALSWKNKKIGLSLDYTGNFYSPMELPTLGPLDPRPLSSPWYSIQNIQVTKALGKSAEIYGGVKNLLNWTPWRKLSNNEIIARANDPFDKNVEFDDNGDAVSTPNNPNGLTFDPAYIYGPNQGIRGFLGIRLTLMKSKK